MNFKEELKEYTSYAEAVLKSYMPECTGYQKTVLDAMNYSVNAGGKRLRPIMLCAAYKMFGGGGTIVEPFMAAIEMIHSYSLIHDDMPELDNDSLRRGMPTTHVRYGADQALLAGDGLLNLAYETALKSFDIARGADRERCIAAVRVLANNAGIYGMVGGQCLDVEADKKRRDLTEEEILFVYENKTAALIEAALKTGAILGGADDRQTATMEKAGSALGIAFQLQDDILDVYGSEKELGKPIGSDERNGKKTYLSYLGIEKAEKEQERLSLEASAMIEEMSGEGNEAGAFLKELFEVLVKRKR
ncbi:MAG: polyprenyl synthetase family protein [Lachnospiraceae bacterium]|nr:polyprenyl synthetase family protein [Lachnospiraceae bacterium]